MSRSEIAYTAFLQYSPQGKSQASVYSRSFRDAVKNDHFISIRGPDGRTQQVRGIPTIVKSLRDHLEIHPFLKKYFGPDVALVPVPRSAPLAHKDALWPPRIICEEMKSVGLAGEVSPFLIRTRAVRKSSTAAKGERPNQDEHYESTAIDNKIPSLIDKPITLVDDIVTRGASFVGMRRRLAEAFPNRQIRCFALIQTISGGDVDKIIYPIESRIIIHANGALHRETGSSNAQQQNLL